MDENTKQALQEQVHKLDHDTLYRMNDFFIDLAPGISERDVWVAVMDEIAYRNSHGDLGWSWDKKD